MDKIKKAPYASLCSLAEIKPLEKGVDIASFDNRAAFEDKALNERLTTAISVLLSLAIKDDCSIEKVDNILIDRLINRIDESISFQIDEITHHESFRELESIWRSLSYLVEKTDLSANTRIEILDIDKKTLQEDFNDSLDIVQSGLYKHVYVSEYDTPGGEPFSAMISPYLFDSSHEDIQLLRDIAEVAARSHCPFIGNVGAKFFNKTQIGEVTRIDDMESYMERAEYLRWNGFRETEHARYIGLTLPRFLLRLPYGESKKNLGFQYYENIGGLSDGPYLWGSAAFALGVNLTRSFKEYGWCVNIHGVESGGRVDDLPLPRYDFGCGEQTKIPTECLLSETRELMLADLGFIPLSYYKNSDHGCFFSANSAQLPKEYESHVASANARINARLPYIFLSARLAHYMKVLQRENIGSNKNQMELERSLNEWLQTLVTKMNNPPPELSATHPLREGKIKVRAISGKPGYFRVNLSVVPHFKIEGIDIHLSLNSEMPGMDVD